MSKKRSFSDINKKYSFLDDGAEGLKDRNRSRAEERRNASTEEDESKKAPRPESQQRRKPKQSNLNRERNKNFDSNLGYTIKMDAESIEKERRRIARKARMEREKQQRRKRFIFFLVMGLVVVFTAVVVKTAFFSKKSNTAKDNPAVTTKDTTEGDSKEYDSLKGFVQTKSAIKYYKENNTETEVGEIPAATYLENYGKIGDYTKIKYLSEFGFVKTVELTNVSKDSNFKVINGVLVVNDEFGLPKDYEPNLSADAKQAFDNMVYKAGNENIKINKASDFVPYDMLEQSFKDGVSSYGEYKADGSQVPAGFSEHQTGLAIDVVDENYDNKYKDSFAETEAYKWLVENAHKNGFIIRYPEGKENVTGRKFEPWHLRFVGTEVALEIKEKNITLEEYLKLAKDNDIDVPTKEQGTDTSQENNKETSEPTKETTKTEN